MGDAGFEPRTSAPEVWCATNEPPHLQVWGSDHDVRLLNNAINRMLPGSGVKLTPELEYFES